MQAVDPQIFPYSSGELTVGPHRIRYLDEGAGDQTILCVHGNPDLELLLAPRGR